MKKHAIIPIFIPHQGCPHDCIFCNQKIITAKNKPITPQDITSIIDTYLSTLKNSSVETIEIGFFGGSFTGLPIDVQNTYLKIAKQYKEKRLIDKIHLSTRPDYINDDILKNLKNFHVDIIELGVQSFNQKVLDASKRGHSVNDIYNACNMIKSYGFDLGIQLMIGLPKDTYESAIKSARLTAKIKPKLARLYPTVILDNTELSHIYTNGLYTPLSEFDCIKICKDMYKILSKASINIMRVGLKSTDLITKDSDISGKYHPAFRQLVEGEIAKEYMLKTILNSKDKKITFLANPKSFSNMIGHKGINKKYFKDNYPDFEISYISDQSIPIGEYVNK